ETEADDESDNVASEPVVIGAGYFTHPCPNATNSSGFGYRTFDNSFHMGLDMAAPEGTPYYAADSGTVLYATNDGGYNGGAGNWVVIAHGNGIVTKYMHSSATYVKPGDYVERGQNIGAVGNTGDSYGAHLHFQVEVGGVAVNPLNYL
ncbi:MAG: M23 family metallopeptidase, partial [Eggerthellaceae bacterium]|nr:M23 family metallopeptidase [Eggerthellaceae bacterium]